jgi:hypothetical protein
MCLQCVTNAKHWVLQKSALNYEKLMQFVQKDCPLIYLLDTKL